MLEEAVKLKKMEFCQMLSGHPYSDNEAIQGSKNSNIENCKSISLMNRDVKFLSKPNPISRFKYHRP